MMWLGLSVLIMMVLVMVVWGLTILLVELAVMFGSCYSDDIKAVHMV